MYRMEERGYYKYSFSSEDDAQITVDFSVEWN